MSYTKSQLLFSPPVQVPDRGREAAAAGQNRSGRSKGGTAVTEHDQIVKIRNIEHLYKLDLKDFPTKKKIKLVVEMYISRENYRKVIKANFFIFISAGVGW